VRLLPGVIQGLRELARAGYALVVVTNQSGVARGLVDEPTLAAIHEQLRCQLANEQVVLDGIEYCPHHMDGSVSRYRCDCPGRKPQPGMLLRAAARLELDLSRSLMIGDQPADILAGQRAGVAATAWLTVDGDWPDDDVPPTLRAARLDLAVTGLLASGSGRNSPS
jgi:D-glycero-D-manno-heptose 1,7-bisphosphate phosphatase